MHPSRKQATLALLALLAPSLAFAAPAAKPVHYTPLQPDVKADYTPPSGATICTPDLYQFGSVGATFTGSLASVAQGAPIAFTGTLTNQNSYPIVDATVYVKIFHSRSTGKDSNGPDVVEYFPAVSHVTIPAKGTKPYSFSWQVPTNEQPGVYKAATFVVSADRFNLLGLTFTDDVVGNTYDFTVVGQDTGAIRFDKSSASVNSAPYYFAVFPPVLPIAQKDIPVDVSVKNTTAVSEKLAVHWSLYDWDALQPSHLITQSDETIAAAAGTSTPVRYELKDTTHTAYELIATLTTKEGAKSIAAFRIGRSGITTPRLNFVGATAYPAAPGGDAYACFQNEGIGTSPNTKVVVTATHMGVLSLLGSIASASFTGPVISQPFYALKAPFKGKASSYVVTAQLYQDGKLLDTVSVPYSCNALGTPCNIFETWWPLVIVAALIALALIFWQFMRPRRSVSSSTTAYTNTPPVPPPAL